MAMTSSNRGLYATACETSQFKTLIDQWLNDGKSNAEISRLLASKGEKISDKSIAKYRSYRDEYVQGELMKDPTYQAQMQLANSTLVDEVSKIRQVNVINHIADTIEHCAELIGQAQLDEIHIRNIQDLRYVQMTMLESLKLYGDTIMQAQKFAKINEDPSLLRPTVENNDVKSALVDILGGVITNGGGSAGFELIDKLRASVSKPIN